MDISQHLVFQQLRIRLEARYLCKAENLNVGRPVFYEGSTRVFNCTVIVDKDVLTDMENKDVPLAAGCVLICPNIGDGTVDIPGCSVIGLKTDISFHLLFNLLQEIYNLFDRWEAGLKAVCRSGGSFQELIDYTEAVVFDPISLADMAFRYVAYCSRSQSRGLADKHVDAQGNVPMEVVNEWVISNVYSEICHKVGVFSFTTHNAYHLCHNIFYRHNVVGRLAIRLYERDEDIVLYYKAVLEHLAQAVSRLYRTHASFNQSEIGRNGLRILLLNCLDQKKCSRKAWEKAVTDNGWMPDDSYLLIQFRPNPRYDKNVYADYLTTEIERRWQGCIGFEYKKRLMLLVNQERFSSDDEHVPFHQVLAYFLRESLLVAGVSRTIRTGKDIYPAYQQTEASIEIGVMETPTCWLLNFDAYALSYLLKYGKGVFAPEYICSQKLLTLKRHDEQKKTEYFATLKTYLWCRFNASVTAKKLFIHRSSFLNRMERIQKLVHIDFNSMDEWLYLVLSYKVMENGDNQITAGQVHLPTPGG